MDLNHGRKMEFVKQEHALMLHGLHEEIKKLQKQCSDMQLQLITNGIDPSEKGKQTVSDGFMAFGAFAMADWIQKKLQEELNSSEMKYEEKVQDCQHLQVELGEKRKLIEQLEQQIESKDERYREDISARNLIIVRLRKEVQEKASTIASLVAFIQSKNKNTNSKSAGGRSGSKSNCKSVGSADDEMSISRKICKRLTTSLAGSFEAGPSQTIQAPSNNAPTIGRQIIEKYFRSSSLPPIPSSSQQSPVKLSSQLNCSMKNISI